MSVAYNTYDPDDAIWVEPEPVKAGTRRMRRWRQKNRRRATIQSIIANHRVRARRAGLLATLTVAEWMTLVEQCGYRCLACGDQPDTLSIGHVIPHSRGGPLTRDNVQPLCMPCNRAQGSKTIDYRRNHALPN